MGRNGLGMMIVLALGGLTFGCDGDTAAVDAGTDAGPTTDGGPISYCPSTGTPAPEELMGDCCWRHSNAEQLATPELRLSYLRITEPAGSLLTSNILTGVLNQAMQEETFNWLVRGEGGDADGPVTLVTGFGRREADGTYAFSTGDAEGDPADWCPIELEGNLSGETLTSTAAVGSVTVPILTEDGTGVQLELILRQIAITEATLSENRSCVGRKTAAPYTYEPAGSLTAFIEVEPAKTGVITEPVETTVCTAIAGENIAEADYCDTTPQGEWKVPPDSLCDESGCTQNTDGTTDVCDPASTCNAWAIAADFAASGVDITNGLCGA